MTILPIVERELRVAARRRLTHWTRFGVALLGIALTVWLMAINRDALFRPQINGKAIFCTLATLSFFFCLGFGAYATADCLSAERREGTLGLLFLTDLRGYDVVLGKLAATSVNGVFALLALLPVLALPLLMGGVAKELVAGSVLALLNTIFFSLTAGLFVSAISQDARRAISGTLMLIGAIAFGLPLVGSLLEAWFGMPWGKGAAEVLNIFSPVYGFFEGLDLLGNSRSAGPFWISQALVQGQAWLFLGLACGILPRVWRRPERSVSRWAIWCERWRKLTRGGTGVMFYPPLGEGNPIAWLSCRHRFGSLKAWGGLAFIGGCWGVGLLTVGEDWLEPAGACMTAMCLHGLLKYQLAGEACRRFAEDRQSGALELLLATPLAVRDILRGQLGALRRRFAGPFGVVLVADALLLVGGWNGAQREGTEFLITVLVGMAMLLVDGVALAWLGMWQGLTSRNFTLAWGKTMFWVLWLPWAVYLFVFITLAMVNWRGLTFAKTLSLWAGLGLAVDAVAIMLVQSRLERRFRVLAAGRFDGRKTKSKKGVGSTTLPADR